MQAVFVAEGQVIEEVFDSGDALFSERLCDLRADAFNELNRGVELYHIAMLSGGLQPTAVRRFESNARSAYASMASR